MLARPNEPIPFKLIGQYDRQKFKQYNPEETSNWYITQSENGKNEFAFYPTMGRKHIRFLNQNRLIFDAQPRGIFKTVNFYYIVVANRIYRFDENFNRVEITTGEISPGVPRTLDTSNGNVYFTYLNVGKVTFACFTDGVRLYVYREDTGIFYKVTDTSLNGIKPTFIVAFGNRILISDENSSFWYISIFNLGGAAFDPATCFGNGTITFNQADGIIGQFGVLHNTLYIFCDFTTEVWSNIPSIFNGVSPPVTFPFKKNTTYNFDYGIQDPQSLDIDFGMMVWLAQNRSGQVQVMVSDGGKPNQVSTKAINLLFEKDTVNDELSPFVELTASGFLYQQDNVIFYRLSAGEYTGIQNLGLNTDSAAVEYSFETKEWHKVIELNGERNRVLKHIYFNNRHLVTVLDDSTVYEMSGNFYVNEVRNPNQLNAQESDAYLQYPFRYVRITPIIHEKDDSEFETEWVQIDFVWGEDTFFFSEGPFPNAVFVIAEEPDADGNPVYVTDEDGNFIITEDSDYPVIGDNQYRNFFKPHIELYYSDDGGIMFLPADVREFSQIGYYQWRMRWYQLGVSRNRVYKLVCVSPAPMIVLNGLMLKKRVSGGAS